MWFLLGVVVGLASPSVAVVEKYLNTSVNPCEDFYQYTCGRWAVVNSEVERGDTLSLLDFLINDKIAGLLEGYPPQHTVPAKMRTFYRACRDLREYSLSSFLDVVKPTSGWAVHTDSWVATDFHWLDVVAELRKYAVHVFLDMAVMPKWDNTSVNSMYLDVVKVDPDTRKSFLEILKKASFEQAESLADVLVAFETELAEVLSHASVESEDAEEVVLGYISETWPHLNWARYLSIVFGRELDLYTPMIIQNTDRMSHLVAFLDRSKREVTCNYIMAKFLQFIDQHGIDDTSRNECMTALHHGMPLAVGYTIEDHFYDPDYDQVVHDLFNFFKVEFLTQVSRMYENQRDALLFLYSKASVMDLQIGNVKRNLTLDAVISYYDDLQLEEGQFYKNLLVAFKFKTQKDLDSLKGVPVNIAHQWTVGPSPFFVQAKNRIVVPLSLLQEQILGRNSADKYSVLEFIIAHEFIHGFDVNGVNYDYQGSMVESAVSRSSLFTEQVKCITSRLKSKGVGEKIADLGGIRLAFNAYRKTATQFGGSLNNFDSSGRTLVQSFFIDFAQFFCGVDKKMQGQVATDVHEPDDMRVRQALMNFEEFANAFLCPLNSQMNPIHKCRVW